MSAVTITFLRFQRSVRAPEKSPNTRYGAASQAATSAVRLGEPLVRYTMIGKVMRGDDVARARQHSRDEVAEEVGVPENRGHGAAGHLAVVSLLRLTGKPVA
jgi:hypothetical protein